jgi:sulfane dehydrogenase subunit SoxC
MSTAPAVHAASATALGLDPMPTELHFRRDHFPPPSADLESPRLEVGGRVDRQLTLDLGALRAHPRRELVVALECAGHRRSEYLPATAGLPWEVGAVSEATWAGASLRDVLEHAGVASSARFVVLEGADRGPFRGGPETPFARALPIAKALHPDTLIAWEMNGEPLPEAHGAPLRAIVPGWYATDSVKWLQRIEVLDEPFAGPFEALDYRIRGERLTAVPPHSLLTSVHDRDRVPQGEQVLSGIAWGGAGGIAAVEISIDGESWKPASLDATRGPYAFTRWSVPWSAQRGLRTVAVRATDTAGTTQPPQPEWNEGGYANSSIQQVRVLVL